MWNFKNPRAKQTNKQKTVEKWTMLISQKEHAQAANRDMNKMLAVTNQ
jgi:hypothetical protein